MFAQNKISFYIASVIRIKVFLPLFIIIFGCSTNTQPEELENNYEPKSKEEKKDLEPNTNSRTFDSEIEAAYALYKNDSLLEAAAIVDTLVDDNQAKLNAQVWLIRGFCYKKLYKSSGDEYSRAVSIESFQRCLQIQSDEPYLSQSTKSIKYLCGSYFNDVVDIIERQNARELYLADEYFSKFMEVSRYLDPLVELKEKQVEFYLAMSTAHRKVFESDRTIYAGHSEKQKEYIEKALEIDPENEKAKYSLAVWNYNQSKNLKTFEGTTQ